MSWHQGFTAKLQKSQGITVEGNQFPVDVIPETLSKDSLKSLKKISKETHNAFQSGRTRLAFRECGLTLGVRALLGEKEELNTTFRTKPTE